MANWDKKELKKRAEKIEKEKNAPSKEVREALKEWMQADRAEHLECRKRSRKSINDSTTSRSCMRANVFPQRKKICQ